MAIKTKVESIILISKIKSNWMAVRTAIREEPIKLAQYLRGEKEDYEPSSDR